MSIIKHGEFRKSPDVELHNNHLFDGAENDILISRMYTTDFECKFSMHYYPFDIQNCELNFVLEVGYNVICLEILKCSLKKIAG